MGVSARWISTSEPSSRLKLVHQLSSRPAAAQLGPERLIFGDQLVEPDRVARRGDDRRHRALVSRAEAVDQQRLEIAERDPAIDRPARREGDQQGVGAPGRAFGPLRRVLDPGQPRFELRDPRRRRRSAAAAVGAGCRAGAATIRCGTAADGCAGRDAEELRGRSDSAPAPRSPAPRRPGAAPGRSAAARSSSVPVRDSWSRHCGVRLVAQPRGEGQQASHRRALRRPRPLPSRRPPPPPPPR